MVLIVVPVLLAFCLYNLYTYLMPPARITSPDKKYVVISGCDTGFGNMLSIQLDKLGYNVIAGCYSQQGMNEIKSKCSQRTTPVQLDVTKQADIDKFAQLVKSKTDSVWALVNNAGIGEGGFVDWVDMEQYRRVMEVNLFGHISMTKSLLPLLIKKRDSRVINITSAAGIIAMPGLSAYSASKFAFEAFSDSLRREMHLFGLRVCIIEPGYMATPIITTGLSLQDKQWKAVSDEVRNRWGDDTHAEYLKSNGRLTGQAGKPQVVVDALIDCVSSTKPYTRYRLGGAKPALLLATMPTFIMDFFMKIFTAGVPKPKYIRDGLQQIVQ